MRKISALILCFVVASYTYALSAKPATEGKTYYTKANIWYEKPEKVISIYHKGAKIPVGTKVRIISQRGDTIRFALESGLEISLINIKEYTTVGLKEFFGEYFSETDVLAPGTAFSRFSKEEQENIKKGELAAGMSKEAVVMAYGRSPAHMTPNLNSDIWVYWRGRFINFHAYFENNKLVSMKSLGKSRQ